MSPKTGSPGTDVGAILHESGGGHRPSVGRHLGRDRPVGRRVGGCERPTDRGFRLDLAIPIVEAVRTTRMGEIGSTAVLIRRPARLAAALSLRCTPRLQTRLGYDN